MRRFLLTGAVFLAATATPAFAGYIVIRVLLEGASGGDSVPGGEGGVGMPPGYGSTYPGGMPSYPAPGGMPGGTSPAAGPVEIDHSSSIVVVIPMTTSLKEERLHPKLNLYPQNNPPYRKLNFEFYGKKYQVFLFIDSSTIQLYDQLIGVPSPRDTRETEMRNRYKVWEKGKTDVQALYDAVLLGLHSGFVKDALAYSEELMKVAGEKKLPLPDRDVKPFVAAWGAMRTAVVGRAAPSPDAEDWRVRIDYKGVHTSLHYAILYVDNRDDEVSRRAQQLDDNFAAFFLWHATRGEVLPVPAKALNVVLAPEGKAMHALRKGLDGLPMNDGFYAPDHDLLVLSPERLDNVGFTFRSQNQQVFVKKLTRDILRGGDSIPLADFTGKDGPKPDEVARASTLAAVEKVATDDADIAAVSREGTRQLLYATGALPRHVTLPTWLSNGAVNFYTRPRGPAYVTIGDDDKPYMCVALTTGYGVPNYVLQRYLRDLAAKKELPADPARLLENVLTDVYFDGIATGTDPDPAPPRKAKKPVAVGGTPPGGMPPRGTMPGPVPPRGTTPGMGGEGGAPLAPGEEDPVAALRKKQQRLAVKANASSWALYYFLTKRKPAQLKEYIAELNRLPRDLPIDGRTAHAVFVRVFNLSTAPDGPADPEAMKRLATEWLDYINTLPPAGQDIPLVVPEPPKPATGGMNPGMGVGIGMPPGGP